MDHLKKSILSHTFCFKNTVYSKDHSSGKVFLIFVPNKINKLEEKHHVESMNFIECEMNFCMFKKLLAQYI